MEYQLFWYNEKEQNQQFSMKNNAYVIIDAQIIRCRLHHNNTLKYSVGLKSGKDASIATEYRPSNNLTIEMNSNLRLYADKYAYDNFPKLTLTVQAEAQGGERRPVGSTFVNYRKEGTQICQVSECSCKDKAFQVEISFSLKILEKISKPQANKNQPAKTTPGNFLSQQPTPRNSREVKLQLPLKPLKDYALSNSQSRLQKLSKVKSQTIIPPFAAEKESKEHSALRKVEVLNDKIRQMQQLERLFLLQRQLSSQLKQLLQLQEEKTREAQKYIYSLQQALESMMTKNNIKPQMSSFKVIEEKDEILLINDQLQAQLQRQIQKNLLLEMEIDELRQEANFAHLKALQVASEKQDLIEELSIIKIKSQVKEYQNANNQILIASVCKSKLEIESLQQKRQLIEALKVQVLSLEEKLKNLKFEVQKYQQMKKDMEDQLAKLKPSPKKAVTKNQVPGVKREEQVPKSQKGNSRQKTGKQVPKMPKKLTIPTSNIQVSQKKSLDVNSHTVSSFKPNGKPLKLPSTEVESKTQRQESMQKSDDFLSQHVNSQKPCDQFNGAVYFTSGLQG